MDDDMTAASEGTEEVTIDFPIKAPNRFQEINILSQLIRDFHIYVLEPEGEITFPPVIHPGKEGELDILDYGSIIRISDFNGFIDGSMSTAKVLRTIETMMQLLEKRNVQEIAFRGFEPAQRKAKVEASTLLSPIMVSNFSDDDLYQHLKKVIEDQKRLNKNLTETKS